MPRRGFTLLEMLVVLALLAALTIVAVQSLEPVAQQSRATATQRAIDELRAALLSVQQSGGQTVVSGFVADLGRLPDLSSPQALYNDLMLGGGLPPAQNFTITTGTSGATATVAAGWRGPYLRTAITSTHLVDGWGRALLVGVEDGTFDALTDRVSIASGGNPATSAGAVGSFVTAAALSASQLTVRLYGIDAQGHRLALTGTGSAALHGGIDSQTSGLLTTTVAAQPSGTDLTCTFLPQLPQLLVGPRVLTVDFTPTTTTTSVVTYPQTMNVNLLPGAMQTIDVLVARDVGGTVTTTTP